VATPKLIQRIVSGENNPAFTTENVNAVKLRLPNAVGAGNCLVLCFTHGSDASSISSIGDSNGNTWPSVAAVTQASTQCHSYIYVLPNANAGVTTVTVTFNTTSQTFHGALYEFNNIATTSPLNGTVSAGVSAGGALSTGSFTPGNNNANGGNLLIQYTAGAWNYEDPPHTTGLFTAGSGWTLLEGCSIGCTHGTQMQVQATSAAINPTMTLANVTTVPFDTMAVALKLAAGSSGTDIPAGIHVDGIHGITTLAASSTTYVFNFPATGNLRVIAEHSSESITGITDSDGQTWTKLGTTSPPRIWYSVNRPANSALTVTLTCSANFSLVSRWNCFDISSALAAPFDISASVTATGTTPPTASNFPTITPGAQPGVTIAIPYVNSGIITAIASPSGAVFPTIDYTGRSNAGALTDHGLGFFYFSSTTAQNWNWTISSSTSTAGIGATFKGVTGTGGALTAASFTDSPATVGSPAFSSVVVFQVGNYVLDNGLNGFLVATATHVCSNIINQYSDVAVYTLGNKTGPIWTGPVNGSPTGRAITSSAFSAGSVTSNGTAKSWAIIDGTNSRLLATGPLAANVALTSGFSFSLDAITIHYPQ
jgi:hypothetical protein